MKRFVCFMVLFVLFFGVFSATGGVQAAYNGFNIQGDPESAQGAVWTYQGVKDGISYDLKGVLFKPKGEGTFPAVVVSHGKGGSSGAYSKGIAVEMVKWGAVVIGVDYTHAREPLGEGAPGTPETKYHGASRENVLRAAMCIELLSQLDYVDSKRLAAHGHSMGAFVTAALVGSYPDRFLAASHTAGGAGTTEETETVFYTRPSQARGIKTPYQIHHGTADKVVSIALDRNLNNIIKGNSIPCEMIEYEGVDHQQIANSSVMLEKVRQWYREHGLFGAVNETAAKPVQTSLPAPSSPAATFTLGEINGRTYKTANYTTHNGVGYGMDVYTPAGTGPFPVILAVHGGGWQNGSRKQMPKALTLIDEGFAVAIIDYRLTDVAAFPAQIQDCKAAVRFLRAHAKELNIDPLRVGAFGTSAGGHLVALLGVTGGLQSHTINGERVDFIGEDRSNLTFSDTVSAVADYFGPTDLFAMGQSGGHGREDSPESKLIGAKITDYPDRCALASPITYVNEHMPPFILLHGTQDNTVPYSQSVMMHEKLVGFGNDAALHLIEGKGHGNLDAVNDKLMFDFFKKHLTNPLPRQQIKLIVGKPFAYLDGLLTEIDPPLGTCALLVEDRVFLPVRFIAEAFVAEVAWEEQTQTVTVRKGQTEIKLQIGSNMLMKNQEQIALDAVPYLEGSRTMLPLRVVAEAMGLEVLWDEATGTVTLKQSN